MSTEAAILLLIGELRAQLAQAIAERDAARAELDAAKKAKA